MHTWFISIWIGVHVAAASTFTNSIYGFADPFLTFHNGRYYLTGSLTGNIRVVSAASLAGLKSGIVSNVYSVGPRVFAESPELHWIASYNHWYIYYTQYPNSVFALESDTIDPQGTYHFKSVLTTNSYDATIARIHDTLYLFSSTYSHLVIQPLSNPYTVDGPQVPIAGLSQSWEHNVIEAPEMVVNPQGALYLLYSAGTYHNDDYAEGALQLKGGNPMVATHWFKLAGPLFRGTATHGNYATATCSPFESPSGETWFVYGGYATSGFTTRSTRAQPMTWSGPDGEPSLGSPLPLGEPIPEPPCRPSTSGDIQANGAVERVRSQR